MDPPGTRCWSVFSIRWSIFAISIHIHLYPSNGISIYIHLHPMLKMQAKMKCSANCTHIHIVLMMKRWTCGSPMGSWKFTTGSRPHWSSESSFQQTWIFYWTDFQHFKEVPSGIYIISMENHRVQWEGSLFQWPLGHWMYLSPAEKSLQVDMVPSIPPLKEPSPSNTKVKAIETGMAKKGN